MDFGALVQDAVRQAGRCGGVAAQQSLEQAGLAAASGKADIVNVVTAIAAGGNARCETVMAVRDQVIQRVSGNPADADLKLLGTSPLN
jgi:hypothetical protein